ncbi:MAG: hypothetical protein ACK5O2_02590 [Microthrixaceae bacterium]
MPDGHTITDTEPTGWVGWIYFAGFILLIGGILSSIAGLVAVLNDQWVVFSNTNALLLDLSGWGWLHLLLGVVLILSGIGVFSGNILARTVGVITAGVSLIANFLWLPAYPIWALVVIAIDLFVIWALIVHGREARHV